MVRIDGMWRQTDGSLRFRGRWYCRPEDAVDGRQVGFSIHQLHHQFCS